MAGSVKPPTLNEVAERAGVSRATAARALGNYGRINSSTAEHVRQTAQQLGYRANQIARAMRAGRTQTIGLVIVADFTNAFFDRATKAIVDSARDHGYQVLITNTDDDIEAERLAVETLVEKQVDGMIVVPASAHLENHLDTGLLGRRPLVLIDRLINGSQVPSVTTDDFGGAKMAVAEIASMGHTRVGHLIASSHVSEIQRIPPGELISTVHQRTAGFREEIENLGLSDQAQWRFVPNSPAIAREAVSEMLDSPEPPTAFLASNNDMAIAVLEVLAERNLRLGADISLITFDDSRWAAAINPGISVVSRPVEDLADQAVKLITSAIDGADIWGNAITLPCTLVRRGSVAERH